MTEEDSSSNGDGVRTWKEKEDELVTAEILLVVNPEQGFDGFQKIYEMNRKWVLVYINLSDLNVLEDASENVMPMPELRNKEVDEKLRGFKDELELKSGWIDTSQHFQLGDGWVLQQIKGNLGETIGFGGGISKIYATIDLEKARVVATQIIATELKSCICGSGVSMIKVNGDLNEKMSWMEKFVRKGAEINAHVPTTPTGTIGLGGFKVPLSKGETLHSDASVVGVLHLVPTFDVFPLLADPKMYEPNTIDFLDRSELEYWFTILSNHLPDLVDKAVVSESETDDAKRRSEVFFFRAFARLMEEPTAYGKLGLAKFLELREECLKKFLQKYKTEEK